MRCARDLAGKGFVSAKARGPAPGRPIFDGVDAKGFHQVEDFDFFGDGGIVDGGILQAVAQGFIV